MIKKTLFLWLMKQAIHIELIVLHYLSINIALIDCLLCQYVSKGENPCQTFPVASLFFPSIGCHSNRLLSVTDWLLNAKKAGLILQIITLFPEVCLI